MILKTQILCISLFFVFLQKAYNQTGSNNEIKYLSGSLESNGNFYIRDSAIGAANIPQYDRQLVGADAWLNVQYVRSGFDIGVRLDVFNNSQLQNPKASYTASGIGRFYVKKKIDNLTIYGGYIYDQIGSGIIFRSYEQRPLGIDNALAGLSLGYQLTDNWKVKVFSGRQKQQFNIYKTTINGFNTEGYVPLKNAALAMGFGAVHRNLDDETVNQLINSLTTYSKADSIGAKFNTFALTAYNTLTTGKWTWYVEGAYKTPEVIFSPFAPKINRNGTISEGKFINEAGRVLYSNLGFATEGLGITLEGKLTKGFTYRTTPFELLNRGTINFLPPMSRQNTFRLTTRYVPATQELGEKAVQLDIKYAPKAKLNIDVNLSNIQDWNGKPLYREAYLSVLIKKDNAQTTIGIQHQNYNQSLYEVKPNVPNVQTITPFFEFQKTINDTKSIRYEAQFMATQQDYGSWVFGLIEYSHAPNWIFTISDMWNVQPKKTSKALHYPSVSAVYSSGSNRFSLAFVKQVEGVVCTGGICRLEPAFSGVKLGVQSSF